MDKLTITNFAKGALVEQFDFEFQRVLDNILDPNTSATATRKVQITVSVKPNKTRTMADITMQAKSTLVPPVGIETQIILDKDHEGNAVAEELGRGQLPGQVDIEELAIPEDDPKVVNIRK